MTKDNMDSTPLSKYTVSFGLSLALCSVVNSVVVVAKEKNPAVAAAMKRMTGHHWVTHAAGIMMLFLIAGWLLSRLNGAWGQQMSARRLIAIVLAGVITGGLVIMGFYLIAD